MKMRKIIYVVLMMVVVVGCTPPGSPAELPLAPSRIGGKDK